VPEWLTWVSAEVRILNLFKKLIVFSCIILNIHHIKLLQSEQPQLPLSVLNGLPNFSLQSGQASSMYSTEPVGSGSFLWYFGCPIGAPNLPLDSFRGGFCFDLLGGVWAFS